MTTQYTPILKLALPVTGELSGTWGDTVNDNITSMVEQAVAGLATISTWTGNSKTLTVANGTTSESRCAMLVAQTGSGGSALTGAGEIVCPASSKLYVLKNDSSFAITLKTAAGTGVAVAAGNTAFLFCDGTNVNACVTTIIDGRVTGNLTVDGNATINGNTTLGNATSDTITATARFASDLVPSTDNARDLGSSGNSWKDVYIDGTAYLALVDINGGTIDGVSIGGTTPATIINVDNLRLDGNTLSSTDTNGNVVIAPNGTGDVQLDADTVRVGDSGAAATLTSNGTGALTVTTGGAANLVLSTNSGTDSGTITINNGANANIVLAPNGTGDVQLDADTVRIGDSNTDVTLTSNGTGNLNLSTNGGTNSGTIQIAQGANGNITLTPNGTGSVSVPKLVWSNGTSGRVPYLTTGGQFTDDADMTFDGTTLTVNGLTVSGTPTFSGGTANGVVYLNASKQATTGTALAFDGNALTLGGSAPRLLSNMSGALSTRFIVQNSTTNGNTRVYLYPNGTGTISAINGVNNSDVAATDYQAFDLAVIGTTDVRLSSSATGAATPLPLTFYTNGSEQMRLNSTALLLGLTSALANGKLQIAGSIGLSGNTQVRQATNGDGNTLQFFGTQFVAGSLNSTSYGYAGGGLVASVSAGDSAVLFDAGRATSTDGRFKVLNTTSGNTAMSLEKNGAYTLYASTTGSVGIGTNSPNSVLDVVGSGDVTLTLRGSGAYTSVLKLQAGGGGASVINATGATDDALLFQLTGSEKARFTSAGKFGISTNNPPEMLSVVTGTAYAAAFNTTVTTASSTRISIGALGSSGGGTGGSSAIGNVTNHSATAQSSLAFYTHDGTNLNEVGRFTPESKLLVGTTVSETFRLVVRGSGMGGIIATAPSAYNGIAHLFGVDGVSNGYQINCTSGNAITHQFSGTGGALYAQIDSTGRMQIGSSTNLYSATLTLKSAGNSYNLTSSRVGGGTGTIGHIVFENDNGAVGTIQTNGSSTIYNTSSDYRLKNITGPITTSGTYIDSLNPVEGTWKADGSTFVGLIAHEAQEVSRTVVATGVKDGEQMQGMDYSSAEIIANLIAEVQSLRKRLAAAGIA